MLSRLLEFFAEKEKIFLDVPYSEKDEAKYLGAKWNPEIKKWYILESNDKNKFTKWLPVKAEYKIYIKNHEKEYYYGLPSTDYTKAVRLALEFKEIAPYIMITNVDDASVWESEYGTIVHPTGDNYLGISRMDLANNLPENMDDILKLISYRNTLNKNSEEFINTEAILFASTIHLEFSLYDFNWSIPS